MKTNILNQTSKKALLANIAISVFAVLVMNGLIYVLGWYNKGEIAYVKKPYYSLPGALVGTVWVFLFAVMGYARWSMNRYEENRIQTPRLFITSLIIFCLMYPFYSLAINSAAGYLIGNVLTILLSIIAVIKVWSISRKSAWLLVPVTVWVAFATTVIMSGLGWF